jgi:RNA ligase (TIGR02306 family)
MRKLASIRRVAEIKPIPGADAIEAIRVDGWWCVSKKNEFKVDDLCVYFEIDSFLPVRPEFEFLRKSCFRSTQNLGDGFRLKTVKLRGQISQGLCLPLDILNGFGDYWKGIVPPNKWSNGTHGVNHEEGADCTEYLGVQKWEVPLPAQLAGDAKGNFPSFIRKTDQERIQNCYNDLLDDHKDDMFEATLKLDGSSMTVYYNNGEFGVCSRNLDLKETEGNTYWKVARNYKFEEAMKQYGRNIAIQGELMGPGIQGNREKLTYHDLFVFDIWNIDEQCYLGAAEKYDVLLDLEDYMDNLEISKVPTIGFDQYIKKFSYDQLLQMSEIKSLTNPIAEGIVYRSIENPEVSFKVINNKFLMKEEG